jgi:hypothetical protein
VKNALPCFYPFPFPYSPFTPLETREKGRVKGEGANGDKGAYTVLPLPFAFPHSPFTIHHSRL